MKRVWVMCCVVALFAGCGGDSDKPPTIVGRNERDSGPSEDVDAGSSSQRGPMIEFLSPEAADTPAHEAVITDRMVTVRCRITRGPNSRASVDEDSIEIWMDKPGPNDMTTRVRTSVAHPEDDEYESVFDVIDMPNGPITFNCSAKDSATRAQMATLARTTLLDLGPTIEVQKPQNRETLALTKPASIAFKVLPAPLAEGDEGAEVDTITLHVSGLEIPFTESEETENLYEASVDFNDRRLFAVAPSSAEVLIAAKNKRAPRAATRSDKRDVTLDGDGPSITVVSPPYGSIANGEISFRVTVSDPAGISPGSLQAVFEGVKDGQDLVIKDWRPGPEGSLVQLVDTVAFDDYLNQVTIQVSATDGVNNVTTRPHQLRLDNMPPVVSLDPPEMREWKQGESDKYCSRPFDPVGDDAANDGEVILPSAMFRVFVEDQTNVSPGDLAPIYAGVNRGKVELFIQGETETPLLIDKNGDGTCDEINAEPASNRPTKVSLTALNPRGAAWYTKDPADFSLTVPGFSCKYDSGGADSSKGPPAGFCPNTAMYRAIPGAADDKPPAIYALNPTHGSGSNCQGSVWMVLPITGPGWACLAARAEDGKENVGISAPLRVCVRTGPDDTTTSCLPGNADELNLPACTSGCTISNAQKFPAMIRKAR